MAKSIRRVQPRDGQRLVALTFDLCERADQISGYDGAIVDVLRQERVPATFFAGGKWMRTHPERTMQLMADPLFEVGSHAWTHGNLRVLEGEKPETQIAWASRNTRCCVMPSASAPLKRGFRTTSLPVFRWRPACFVFHTASVRRSRSRRWGSSAWQPFSGT
jgi:peptidoglycan/xylan/chitin deacetylase (PgdA/CDA1 family)